MAEKLELALNSNHSLDFHVDGASNPFLSYILLRQFHSRHRKFIVDITIAGCEIVELVAIFFSHVGKS